MPTGFSRRQILQQAAAGAGFLGWAKFAPAAGTPPGVLTFRHIHLDFHTSPYITDVGADFDAAEFARVLKEASVNSITIFGKCHHGMSYYPTKVGVQHPTLKKDLVGGMIEACHRQGIRVPVYISTLYDQRIWREHAEWRAYNEEGRSLALRGPAPLLQPQLGLLCINTPYYDYVIAQADEVLRNYEADGIFYDNFSYPPNGCFGPSCMLEREKLGLESAKQADRQKHAYIVMTRAMDQFAATVRARKPKAGIFINGPFRMGQPPEFLRHVVNDYTHVEIESLPGGSWGYSHFQMASRYVRNFGLEAQGMTGAFHRSWGDFGTVRNQAALDYECFSMLAQATKCAVGDHLHPRGRLNGPTYERIGRTYRSVVEKEPWCEGATAVVDIAYLLNPNAARANESAMGVTGMLTQLHHQFDVIDRAADFSRYRVLVLADNVRLDAALRNKLTAYTNGGGALVLSHESGLDEDGKSFALPGLALEYAGPWKHESQYLEVLEPVRDGIPDMVHEMYETGSAVRAQAGATVLARVWDGYFDRNYREFQVEQTPFAKPSSFIAAAQSGKTVYFAVPIFRAYARHGYPVYRRLVGNSIARLMPDPLVKAEAPSTAQVTMTAQRNRHIVHVLNYIPERRSPDLDIVEDVIPIHNVGLAARLKKRPSRAYLAPQKENLSFDYRDGYARVKVPTVTGHQMVVFED